MPEKVRLDEPDKAPVKPPSVRPQGAAGIDNFLSRFVLPCLRIGREMKRFAVRMEQEDFLQPNAPGFTGAAERGQNEGDLHLRPHEGPLEPWQRLSAFLEDLGVREVILNTDLESDQIMDTLQLLWCTRRALTGNHPRWLDRLARRGAVADAIRSPDGMHVSCTNVRLDDDGVLRLQNSYCTLTFSRAVTAYMQKVSSFPDHRAFFRAAPRYGLLAALLTLVPCILGQFAPLSTEIILAVGFAVALILGAGVMVVFETIGAIEYDKEHQAKQIRRRHLSLMRAYDRIEEDLERAQKIQRKLVPSGDDQPWPDVLRLAHQFEPQMQVGGDYYDYKRTGEDRLVFLFADVSGHGMASAFITGIIKTAFEVAHIDRSSPREFVSDLNTLLTHVTPEGSYAAVIFAFYNPQNRCISYVNAGHQPVPMVMRRENGRITKTGKGTGPVAGFTQNATYEQNEIELEPGDRFILCTDGVTEAFNESDEQFGEERLMGVLEEMGREPIEELPPRILQAVSEHCGDCEQTDDRAILVLEAV